MDTPRYYTKEALSISDQIELLKNRGLNIADYSKATKFLGEVSYFRFVQYLRPMEEDKTTHQFKPNSQLDDAVALYNFDIELRDLMFKAIQRLEIALRTKIIQEFSLQYGPFWFFDTSLIDDEHKYIENLNSIDRELQRSKEDFIKEHRQNYDRPIFPPAWKTLELASFGTLSKLYYNFSDKKLKKRIAHQFNLPQHVVLESWMRSVTVLRNYCAHHSRLWNRYLPNAPQMNASLRGTWINIEGIDANKVYAITCCIAYWLDSMGYGNKFKNDLKSLLNSYTQIDPTAMGFPNNWKSEPLWNNSTK
jgi:abortive infection bacteriophage resistance protein|nr:Abi family protein [uncultured Prevotella sp.]